MRSFMRIGKCEINGDLHVAATNRRAIRQQARQTMTVSQSSSMNPQTQSLPAAQEPRQDETAQPLALLQGWRKAVGQQTTRMPMVEKIVGRGRSTTAPSPASRERIGVRAVSSWLQLAPNAASGHPLGSGEKVMNLSPANASPLCASGRAQSAAVRYCPPTHTAGASCLFSR